MELVSLKNIYYSVGMHNFFFTQTLSNSSHHEEVDTDKKELFVYDQEEDKTS